MDHSRSGSWASKVKITSETRNPSPIPVNTRAKRSKNMKVLGTLSSRLNMGAQGQSSQDPATNQELKNFCRAEKMELNQLTENFISFDLTGSTKEVAQEFARIIKEEIETMAFTSVEVHKNGSDVEKEELIKSVKLIPIIANPDDFKSIDSSGTTGNSARFELKVKNVDTYSSVRAVTSSDFKLLHEGLNPINVCKDIHIAYLMAGKEIHVEALATPGFGKNNVVWCPVQAAWYTYVPKINLLADFLDDDAERLKSKCEFGVFDIEETMTGKKKAIIAKPQACTFCNKCADNDNRVLVHSDESHMRFTIETNGTLSPMTVYNKAVEIWEATMEYGQGHWTRRI